MTDFTKSLAVALTLCAAATSGFAQDATSTDKTAPDAATNTATDTTAPAASSTDNTTAAKPSDQTPAEPKNGSSYFADTFGDWKMQCFHNDKGVDPCQMYQLMKDDKGNAVADITMVALPPGGKAVAGATIMTPLETMLTHNVVLKPDDSDAKAYPFTFCAPIGCFARVGLTQDELNAYKKGKQVALTVVPMAAPDHPVTVTISLKGFSAAYDAATKNAAELQKAAKDAAPKK